MRILWAPEHSVKRTMASIGSVFSLNSPQYQFLDHFHMTGCICALRTMRKTLFHFGKVCIKGWMKARRSTGSLIMTRLIGKETAAASNTIPALFGQRTLNIYTEAHVFMAEDWSFWLIHLTPLLLKGCF